MYSNPHMEYYYHTPSYHPFPPSYPNTTTLTTSFPSHFPNTSPFVTTSQNFSYNHGYTPHQQPPPTFQHPQHFNQHNLFPHPQAWNPQPPQNPHFCTLPNSQSTNTILKTNSTFPFLNHEHKPTPPLSLPQNSASGNPIYNESWQNPLPKPPFPYSNTVPPFGLVKPAPHPNTYDSHTLLNKFGDLMSSQQWHDIKEIFEAWVRSLDKNGKPNKPDVNLFNHYLKANLMMGASAIELLDLLGQMENFSVEPNTASFDLVLKVGETLPVEKLLEQMLQSGNKALQDDESYDLVHERIFSTDHIDVDNQLANNFLQGSNDETDNDDDEGKASGLESGSLVEMFPVVELMEFDDDRPYLPGENVFLSYGNKSNEELLLSNGFVPREGTNPSDYVELPLSLKKSDESYKEKLELLRKCDDADPYDKLVKDLILLFFESSFLNFVFTLDDLNTFGSNIHKFLKLRLSIDDDSAEIDVALLKSCGNLSSHVWQVYDNLRGFLFMRQLKILFMEESAMYLSRHHQSTFMSLSNVFDLIPVSDKVVALDIYLSIQQALHVQVLYKHGLYVVPYLSKTSKLKWINLSGCVSLEAVHPSDFRLFDDNFLRKLLEGNLAKDSACQNWTLCKHTFYDLAHVSPVVFMFMLSKCYYYGNCEVTMKFQALQEQLCLVLCNDTKPELTTFVVQCLYVAPMCDNQKSCFTLQPPSKPPDPKFNINNSIIPLQPLSKVSVIEPNFPATYESHFAIPMAVCVLNTVNTRLNTSIIAFLLSHCNASIVIVDQESFTLAEEALKIWSKKTNSFKPPILIVIGDENCDTKPLRFTLSKGAINYEDFLQIGDPEFYWTKAGDKWQSIACAFASRYIREAVPKFKPLESSIPKNAAYRIINDEFMLDGKLRLNLASFVTTLMEPVCDNLIMDSLNKNYVDMDEYPATTELHKPNSITLVSVFPAVADIKSSRIGREIQMLSGIDIDSGMRVIDDTFWLSKCVQLFCLYLEDDGVVNAEAFINKASLLVSNSQHEVLNLKYKVCYARIYPRLQKVYLERNLRRPEIDAFAEELKAFLPNNFTVLIRAKIEQTLLNMDPYNYGAFVMLYVDVGKWNNVNKVRIMIKEQGIKKHTPYRWMHIGNKLLYFAGGGLSHPNIDNFREALRRIALHMKEKGNYEGKGYKLNKLLYSMHVLRVMAKESC